MNLLHPGRVLRWTCLILLACTTSFAQDEADMGTDFHGYMEEMKELEEDYKRETEIMDKHEVSLVVHSSRL